MFRLVVLDDEVFAALVTSDTLGEDVIHWRYHDCFLATQRTCEQALVELGQLIDGHLAILRAVRSRHIPGYRLHIRR